MAEEEPAGKARRPDPLSVLWRVLCAPQMLLVLLGLLVLSLVAASLIPQIPLSARSNPMQWLAAQSSLAGSAWIRSLNLYDISHSLWMRVLLALLGATLLVRMAEAVEIAWHATAPGRWTVDCFRFWSRSRCEEHVSTLPPAEAVDETERRLAGGGYRRSPISDGPVRTYVASRRAWALWVAPVAYAGSVVALVGVLLLITWGWQSEQWQPRLGESRSVGADGATTVRMEGFDLQRDASGNVIAATTLISWQAGEGTLSQSTASTGYPATQGGLAVRQLGYVPVLSIRGWDEEGRPLLLQEEAGPGLPTDVEVVFPDPEARPVLFLEKQDRLLVLSFEQGRRGGRPALRFALTTSAGEEQVPLGILYESGSVGVDGSRLQVDMTFRPILRADYLPGVALAIAGSALTLVALALVWLVRPKLAWIAAAPNQAGGTRIQVALFPSSGEGRRTGYAPEEAASAGPASLPVRVDAFLHGAGRAAFLVLGAALVAGAAWAWRTTGSVSGHAVPAGWPLAGLLLAAMSLLAWHLRYRGVRWAAVLAVLSVAALLAGLFA